ncbi:MAG TPA: alpha-amylase/4-alpha-glucanotransferase domain-containing protein, partial [Candidatus Polarisedimenticolia bacterium]|nr:alpha-amylase/4-alpha-glucanotransferase domain-containing protein [Candidatus Polarisedimenticolia bacterium]
MSAVPSPKAAAPVRLVLALHFHQPVGNFDSVFREAIDRSYDPLVDHFERHPGVRAGFHLSGCLIEWLEAHDRGLLDRVLALVGRGQVEPLGGGFYEPILPVIPRADALDQIERLSAWWEKRAGLRPRGAWIAERVWEPALADLLSEAGVQYTILDDQHLRFAGLLDERFTGIFATERAGRGVAFFPSDSALRYLIPFRPIATVREHLEAARTLAPPDAAAGPVLTYGDDAEKFGLWPETHAWVYGERWLEQFMSLLEEPDGPAIGVQPADVIAGRPPARKVYVPNASYTEMLEWALPAASVAAYGRARDAASERAGREAARAFVRGSLWDMFLARYPEADQLHKHVLWSSRRARGLEASAPERGPALTAALRAECNCAYWHGLFGGIYYSHLRHGLYHSLLEADALLAKHGSPVVERIDLDGDLEDELVLRAGRMQAFFRPSDAGTLVELDDLESRFNVTNVLSRFRESYHEGADLTHGGEGEGAVASPHEQKVGIEAKDLEGRAFDLLPLRSLRDFTAAEPPAPEALARFEWMTLLAGRPASWEETARGFRHRIETTDFDADREVTIDAEGALHVRWSVRRGPAGGVFGTLLALTLLTPKDEQRRRYVIAAEAGPGRPRPIEEEPGAPAARPGVSGLILEDRVFGFALDLRVEPAAHLTATPIETLQRAEVRYEKAYQGTLFALCWRLPRAGKASTPQESAASLVLR